MWKRSTSSFAGIDRALLVAAAVEQVGEQRLKEAEPLGSDWPGGPLRLDRLAGLALCSDLRRLSLVDLAHVSSGPR